jgi:catechol 2,3-dioxygenase-like lactoylglutathione lyase family enzyme
LIEFYTGLLGMRLLLRTGNPDEPDVLQFYCSAADGAPGSIPSFLVRPEAPRGRRGNGQVSGVTLAVPPRSLDYWQRRLACSGASKG